MDVSREFLESRLHMTYREIAAELGCTRQAVSNMMRHHGLAEAALASSISREFLQAHLWMRQDEMARLRGVSKANILAALRRHGLYTDWLRMRGHGRDGCPCGKVDPARCRELCAAGQPVLCEVKR